MALRTILLDDNPRLRLKSQKVTKFDKELRILAEDMMETMQTANGIGLAAPQVGVLKRLLVVDIPEGLETETSPAFQCVLVNPELVKCKGEDVGEEGCLSVPNWYGEVKRFWEITVRAQDVFGRQIKFKVEGLPARAIQHEIDHLDGIIFTDLVVDAATLRKIEPKDEEETADGRKLARVV